MSQAKKIILLHKQRLQNQDPNRVGEQLKKAKSNLYFEKFTHNLKNEVS